MLHLGKMIVLAGVLVLAGCQSRGLAPTDYARARFVLEAVSEDAYSALVTLPLSGVQIPVEGDAVLSEFDYEKIAIAELQLGKCLVFSLKPPAARAFYQISVGSQGRRIVLVVNGKALAARKIDGPVADGQLFVFVEATDERLEELAEKLKRTNFDIQKKLSN